MGLNVKDFNRAADESVKPAFRAGRWRVWECYDVIDIDQANDAYVHGRERVNHADVIAKEYLPLQVSGLFLEFARLADEQEVTRDVWLDWVERYGVLGFNLRDPKDIMMIELLGPVCQEGGPRESYKRFVQEAKEASLVLRFFESLASPEGPNYTEFFKEAYEILGWEVVSTSAREMTPDEAKRSALSMIRDTVQYKVQDCFPMLLPAEERFVQGWGFHTLLAAMYLQMMWLLTTTGDEILWCKRRECTRLITYEQPEQPKDPDVKKNDRSKGYRTRRDKEFCSDRCRALYYYHNVKKYKHHDEGA
jgi:hypothetical protein